MAHVNVGNFLMPRVVGTSTPSSQIASATAASSKQWMQIHSSATCCRLPFMTSLNSFKVSKPVVASQANGRLMPTQAVDAGSVTLISPCMTVEDGKTEHAAMTTKIPLHELRHGELLENRRLYRQKFVIRSYEVGADKETSITTIFSLLQELSLCHVHLMGIAGDGFGATKAMNRLGLIWVVAKMHVEVDEFPKWPDVIEMDSWIARAGKNGMRRDWIVRRYDTNEVLVRATSTWCMMDSTTRRLCKMPDAARAELNPFFLDDQFVFPQTDMLSARISKLDNQTAKYLSPPLQSCRADLDVNQHVSNHKYIAWALQGVPEEHLETHTLKSITIEYRRECHSKNVVESLTSAKMTMEECASSVPSEGFWSFFVNSGLLPCCEFTHLLQTQDVAQHEIVRARTSWRPKPPPTTINQES